MFIFLQGGPKNGATLIFKNSSVKKLTHFSTFWYTESRRNVTSDDYKFIHHTCKMQPLYLVKIRQRSSDRSQYQIKRVNNGTFTSVWKFLEVTVYQGSYLNKCSIWPPFICTTHSRRRRHSLILQSVNACDSCCQALTTACLRRRLERVVQQNGGHIEHLFK